MEKKQEEKKQEEKKQEEKKKETGKLKTLQDTALKELDRTVADADGLAEDEESYKRISSLTPEDLMQPFTV